MAYLAKKSFVHRDLAARNILLDQRMSCKVWYFIILYPLWCVIPVALHDAWCLQIGDFGMARDLMDNTYYKSSGGKIPVKWTAPEALLYKKYSTASDVWSYAMVLYEIWSVGQKPFQQLNNSDMIARLQNHLCQAPPPGCPRMVYALMVDCWSVILLKICLLCMHLPYYAFKRYTLHV